MKYIITGGAGFLGYHLADFLIKKKHKVAIVDIDDSHKQEYSDKVEFFKTDVRDYKALEKIFRNADVVIHAAAALPRWKAREIYDININGTKNALEAAIKNKVERFIFISSTAVYGIPKKHPIYESDQLAGKEIGPYGDSKVKAEKLCKSYRDKLCVTIIRPKTFIGTGRLGVFQILYDWVKEGKRIPMIGRGNNKYQLLDVDDLVEIIYLISKAPKEKVNDTFNIGAEMFGTIKESLIALCDYAKTGAQPLATPAYIVKPILKLFEVLKISPLYKWVYETLDKDSFVSIEKIKKAIKWKPKYSNKDALIKSYKWYLQHYEELKTLKSGVTHRVAWNQGILGLFKKIL